MTDWYDSVPIQSIDDLRDIYSICGWGGFENITDESFKEYIIERCQALELMDYLPDSWGGDERRL